MNWRYGKFYGDIREILRRHSGSFTETFGKFTETFGKFTETFGKFYGDIREVLRRHSGSFAETEHDHTWRWNGGCAGGISRYSGQWYRLLNTWHEIYTACFNLSWPTGGPNRGITWHRQRRMWRDHSRSKIHRKCRWLVLTLFIIHLVTCDTFISKGKM